MNKFQYIKNIKYIYIYDSIIQTIVIIKCLYLLAITLSFNCLVAQLLCDKILGLQVSHCPLPDVLVI